MLGTQFYANNSIRFDRQRIVGQGENNYFYLVRETSVVTESPEAVRIRRALDRLGVDITLFSPHIQFWPKIVFTQKSVPDCVLIWETLQDCPDLTKSNYHCQTSL